MTYTGANTMALDVLSIGDATIDRFLFINDAHVNCEIKSEECQLCFVYGDKLPVEQMRHSVAGNACNNAVANARCGFQTALLTIVGDDLNGQWIIDQLKKEKVQTGHIIKQKNGETNASTVLSFKGERTIFVYHAPRVYALPKKMPRARMLYYTSVGPNHLKLNHQLAHHVKKTGVKLGFNPGTYQMREGLEAMSPVLAVTDTLFVNKEEAARILAVHGSIAEHTEAFHNLGVRTVVITDGVNGAYASDRQHIYHLGIPHTKVIERTGAGDSFASGFMAAQFSGLPITEAMRWGSANSSSVVMYVGPQAGLLTIPQIKNFITKNKIGQPQITV